MYWGICSLIVSTFLFCTVQAEGKKSLEEFLQGTIALNFAVETFEKTNPIVSQLLCTSCKEKSTYGLIVGTVIGRGLMAAMKGEDLSELAEISSNMINVLSTNSLSEVDQFMLNMVQRLEIQCPECEAMRWVLDQEK